MDNRDAPAHLIASPETLDYLGGLAPYISERAGTDYLMVISERGRNQKFTPNLKNSSEEMLKELKDFSERHTGLALPDELRQTIDEMPFVQNATFRSIMISSQFSSPFTGNKSTGGSEENGEAAQGTSFILPNGQTMGVIIMNTKMLDGPSLWGPSAESGPRAPNASGAYSNNAAFAILHELGHVRERPSFTPMEYFSNLVERSSVDLDQRRAGETFADREATAQYNEAYKAGLVGNPDTPRNIVQSRLMERVRSARHSPDGTPLKPDSHATDSQIIASGNTDVPNVRTHADYDVGFERFLRRLDVGISDTYLRPGAIKHEKSGNFDPQSFREEAFAALSKTDQRVVQGCANGSFAKRLNDPNTDQSTLRKSFGTCVRTWANIETVGPALERMKEESPSGTMDHSFASATQEALKRERAATPITDGIKPEILAPVTP